MPRTANNRRSLKAEVEPKADPLGLYSTADSYLIDTIIDLNLTLQQVISPGLRNGFYTTLVTDSSFLIRTYAYI